MFIYLCNIYVFEKQMFFSLYELHFKFDNVHN